MSSLKALDLNVSGLSKCKGPNRWHLNLGRNGGAVFGVSQLRLRTGNAVIASGFGERELAW